MNDTMKAILVGAAVVVLYFTIGPILYAFGWLLTGMVGIILGVGFAWFIGICLICLYHGAKRWLYGDTKKEEANDAK